jgi:anti-anti-sigma factor
VVFVDGAAVILVSGAVDPATAPALDEAIRRAESYRPRVVVDLSGCTFMDSSGLEVLVGAHTRTDGLDRGFVVRSPHAFVARVLEISGVDQFLVVEPDPPES